MQFIITKGLLISMNYLLVILIILVGLLSIALVLTLLYKGKINKMSAVVIGLTLIPIRRERVNVKHD